ncbi:MAG: hypothetical protein EBR09_03280 [Proteobacteria bacterium]|nr:hypothetical protein [Pseudomonadota bacterium]
MLRFTGLVFGLLAATCACVPRSFNAGEKSRINESPQDFSKWFSQLPAGPVANYELMSKVVFHKVGSEILPDFTSKAVPNSKLEKRIELTNIGGNKGSADGGVSMVWMRDYFPFVIKSSAPDAAGKARFIPYLSINPARNKFSSSLGVDSTEGMLNPNFVAIDNEVIGSQRETVSMLTMPLLIEGGNLISTGDHLILTDYVFTQNSPAYVDFLSRSGKNFNKESLEKIFKENDFYRENNRGEKFEYRSPDQVKSVLSRYLEVDTSKLIFLPALPGEGTHHVDLFVLALGRKHLMIPEITEEGIATLAFEQEKTLARTAMAFLNAQALLLSSQYDYKVDRLPMIPPIWQTETGSEKQAVFFSPANSLLANLGPDRKKVLLPHFEVPADWGEPFRLYSARVEQRWKEYFEANGWQPTFVPANKAARAYGLVRCLTAVVPFVSERHMLRFAKLGY